MDENTSRKLIGVGAVVVAIGALAWLSYGNLGNNLVYYWSPSEIVEKGSSAEGALVRLGGLVVPGTFKLEDCKPGCTFRISDGKTEVQIATQGLPPQMFREGIGVVVEGRMEGDTFVTDRVMVKHSNEYRAPTDAEGMKQAYTTVEVE